MPKKNPGGPAALRSLVAGRRAVAVPGVFNPAVALLAEEAGFDALYLSGAAFANSLGMPDVGATTMTEVAEMTRRILSAVPSLPLIVDVDTGFGEAVNVGRTVREMERAGAAAVQIEDQVMPKRCGHLDGKEVVDPRAMVEKVIAAKEAAKSLLVIARTDAAEKEGLDGAVRRATLYRRAGADVIFPEALRTKAEFIEFARRVDGPLLANMTEFGKTPYTTISEFSEMGYKLVIFPVTVFRAAMKAAGEALAEVARSGTQKAMLGRLMTRDEFNALVGYSTAEREDREVSKKASRVR
ncbi:MAG TPA: methylisocitrate lyase [Nitrososphaerales archaeon]|nr:methylisocitrate lyase [Nitrososphaerales archaeon]HUK74659.1 methylisocitrate lyase [Nitrososphaerales archaeon]